MIQIQAAATDNVGVAGVRFQVDGEDAGAEVLSPPYTATFNAALLPSGQHVLRARARDGAGNLCMALVEYAAGDARRWMLRHLEDCPLQTFEPEDRLDGMTRP
jgi:hypothetical protein